MRKKEPHRQSSLPHIISFLLPRLQRSLPASRFQGHRRFVPVWLVIPSYPPDWCLLRCLSSRSPPRSGAAAPTLRLYSRAGSPPVKLSVCTHAKWSFSSFLQQVFWNASMYSPAQLPLQPFLPVGSPAPASGTQAARPFLFLPVIQFNIWFPSSSLISFLQSLQSLPKRPSSAISDMRYHHCIQYHPLPVVCWLQTQSCIKSINPASP